MKAIKINFTVPKTSLHNHAGLYPLFLGLNVTVFQSSRKRRIRVKYELLYLKIFPFSSLDRYFSWEGQCTLRMIFTFPPFEDIVLVAVAICSIIPVSDLWLFEHDLSTLDLKLKKKKFFWIMCVCDGPVCCSTLVDVRSQCCRVDPFLPLHGIRGLNSGHQAYLACLTRSLFRWF